MGQGFCHEHLKGALIHAAAGQLACEQTSKQKKWVAVWLSSQTLQLCGRLFPMM